MSTIKGVKPERGAADKALYFDKCRVFWITLSVPTTTTALELNDSGNDSGDDVWKVSVVNGLCLHCVFDPPMLFEYGLYVDIDQTTSSFTIGALPGHGEEDDS